MANYRGEEGSVKFKNSAGTAEAGVQTTSWTLGLAKEVLEPTVQGDTARTYVGGLISGSGSIEFNYTAASGNETKNLIDDVLATEDGGDAVFEFYIDTSGSKKWSFSGIITGISASTTVGELTSVSATYQASGAITSAV